jgi:hypothetical protein
MYSRKSPKISLEFYEDKKHGCSRNYMKNGCNREEYFKNCYRKERNTMA